MDVTPQLLKDVDFREKKFGGYDPDEVDDFLERVGVAIGQLQMRLRETTQRAEAAEARLAAVPTAAPEPIAVEDDTLRRTLLLAQRTADAAVAEAQEESDRIIAAARDEAERIRLEDQERHEQHLHESQEEIRHSVDEIRAQLLAEIDELEGIRNQLMSDVEILERHVDDERARLTTTVGTLQGLLDAAGSMAPLEPPVISGATGPAEAAPNFDAPEPTTEPEPQADYEAFEPPAPAAFEAVPEPPAPAPTPEPAFEAPPPEPSIADTPSFIDGPPTEAAPIFEPEPLPSAPSFAEPPVEGAGSMWDTPADDVFGGAPVEADQGPDLFAQPPPPPPKPAAEPSGFGGLGGPAGAGDPWSDLPGTGPSTQAQEPVGPDAGGDNPWMADLAREEAANQPPPAPPAGDEDAMAEWYRQQEEAGGEKSDKKRFGRGKK